MAQFRILVTAATLGLGLGLGFAFALAPTALNAMPAALVNAAVQAPIEKVYGGCGVYGHRGPYGGCRAGGQATGSRYRR
jgi:hypothetical protein